MIDTKQLLFTESRKIKDGVARGKVWSLWGYKTSDGQEYASFDQYPLNTNLLMEYEEVEVPSRDGKRTFINRKLLSQVTPKEKNFGTEEQTQLSRIEDKLDELLERSNK